MKPGSGSGKSCSFQASDGIPEELPTTGAEEVLCPSCIAVVQSLSEEGLTRNINGDVCPGAGKPWVSIPFFL